MSIYLNREEEIKGKAPLEFYGDGQNLKDWEIQGRTSENLYPISIGEDMFEDVVNGSHTNNDGELVVSMASNKDSGCRTTISSELINLLQNGHTYSWSVELKADTPMSVRLGFYSNYVSDVNITAEYIRYAFDSQILSPNDIFIIYNRTGVAHTVYLRNFMINLGSTALPYEPYGGVGVRTENLFDKDATEDAYIDVEGNIHSSTKSKTSNYIPVLENTSYTLYMNGDISSTNPTSIVFFDLNKDLLSYTTYVPQQGSQSIPINTPASASYVRFSVNNLRENVMFTLGSTAPSTYIPYGYKIPIKIDGENLFDSELEQGGVTISGNIIASSARVYGYAYVKPQTAYTIASNKAFRLCYGYNDDGTSINNVGLIFDNNSGNNKLITFTTPEGCNYIRFAMWNGDASNIIPTDVQNLVLVEGRYTASTLPPYEVNLYTDHQLMDGDSISLSSTQINIPTLNTHNILTVPTQVQPSNITLTLPQTEIEITKILGPLISPRYDITDAYFGNLQVFTVWDTYTGPLPTTLYTTDWGLVDYKIYGTADGAGIKTKNLYNYNASGAVSLNLYPSEENGKLLSGQNNVSIIFAVKPDTIYSIYKLSTTRFRWACYAAAPQEGDEATSFSSSISNTNIMITFVTDSNAAYAVVFIKASSDSIDRDVLLRSVVVVEGPYAARDVPYGYKIPMRSQNSVVDIYIGDTPLGENEYVSYSEQKIYRYINGVLTPTDPPKELPTITTINGNTTIDTTLEEKQYITSDNKVYCVKNGGRYLLKGSGLRPDNFYSKYRKGGT